MLYVHPTFIWPLSHKTRNSYCNSTNVKCSVPIKYALWLIGGLGREAEKFWITGALRYDRQLKTTCWCDTNPGLAPRTLYVALCCFSLVSLSLRVLVPGWQVDKAVTGIWLWPILGRNWKADEEVTLSYNTTRLPNNSVGEIWSSTQNMCFRFLSCTVYLTMLFQKLNIASTEGEMMN
jgi:hypothetical protein